MPLKTVSSQRTRTEVKTFSDNTLSDLEAAFATYETAKAETEEKTYTVRIVGSGWDGTNYFLIAEASYPEINTDPLGQVPILGGGE